MTLGQIISENRNKKSMTQQELADKAGISRSHLAALETGHYSPSINTLVRIAHAMDLRLELRFANPEDPEVKPHE